MGVGGWVGVGGIPSDYLVSTQLQLWLFCCWGCSCRRAVTIKQLNKKSKLLEGLGRKYYVLIIQSIHFLFFHHLINKTLLVGLIHFPKIGKPLDPIKEQTPPACKHCLYLL